MKDLANELRKQGHAPIVLTPNPNAKKYFSEEVIDGVKIITVKGFKIKSNYFFLHRGILELITPFIIIFQLSINWYNLKNIDGIVWYSPSTFFGPLIYFIKKISKARTYLILRDHYPEDLVNIGVMKNSFLILIFKFFNKFQFNLADKIGVQSINSKSYLNKYNIKKDKVETLYNWSDDENDMPLYDNNLLSEIKKSRTLLFLGTLSVSQNNDIIYKIINLYKSSSDVKILFVGAGSELKKIRDFINKYSITNVIISNTIHPHFIKDLCQHCHSGFIFLNKKHISHNIPGKFITYLRSGLPIIADINSNSDLGELIKNYDLGIVNTSNENEKFLKKIDTLIKDKERLRENSYNCINLFNSNFKVEDKVTQILKTLYA